MGLGDQVGKQAADEIVSQFPQLEDFINKQLTNLQGTVTTIVKNACDEINTVVGGALNDITAERTELVKDINGLLDRIKVSIEIK